MPKKNDEEPEDTPSPADDPDYDNWLALQEIREEQRSDFEAEQALEQKTKENEGWYDPEDRTPDD